MRATPDLHRLFCSPEGTPVVVDCPLLGARDPIATVGVWDCCTDRRQFRSGSLSGCCGHDCFVFKRGQSAEPGLVSAAEVSPFDPAHDRDPELTTRDPRPTVEDVLLQQGEELFHRGVVTAGTDPFHRADHLVSTQGAEELPGPKLIRGRCERCSRRPGHQPRRAWSRRSQGIDRQAGLHP